LACACSRGDVRAQRRLIESNLRLVASVARRQVGGGPALADLIQEGNLGLIRAASKFDPSYGCRFSTYAYRWIQAAVGRSLARDKGSVDIGQELRQLARTEEWLCGELGRRPTSSELATELGIAPSIGAAGDAYDCESVRCRPAA